MRFDQPRGLRKSMSWLHTWAGLSLGWLLFAIFVTGTLSYFRSEITLWMQPELQVARPDEHGLERALALLRRLAPDAAQWQISPPGERSPVYGLGWREAESPRGDSAAGSPRGAAEGRAETDETSASRRARHAGMGAEGDAPRGERGAADTGRHRGEASGRAGDDGAAGQAQRSAHAPGMREGRGHPPEALAAAQAGAQPDGAIDLKPNANSARGGSGQGHNGGGGGGHGGPRVSMDPATGAVLAPRQTAGGDFLYRFHFELYGLDRGLARWIVGIATMFMFAAMVSGVIIHRNIFKDFFSFRAGKGKRSWLDAHNATSVFALPFHLMITFSGLLLLANQVMPWAATYAYGGSTRAMMGEMKNMHSESVPPRMGTPAPLTPLVPLLAAAQAQWPQQGVGAITIINPGDAGARVELRQGRGESLGTRAYPQSMVFDGSSGKLLEAPAAAQAGSAVRAIWSGMNALHLGRFASPLLRWLLFFSGVLGCVMVASGLVMWVLARQREREERGRTPFGHRIVEVLNVASVAGLLVALGAYFWGSRLIPAGLEDRSVMEIRVFFVVWLLSVPHAWLRSYRQAWVEQLAAAGALTLLLPVLGGFSGGVWLPLSLLVGQGEVAGFDLAALLLGALILLAAWRTHRHVARPRAGARPEVPAGTMLQAEEA